MPVELELTRRRPMGTASPIFQSITAELDSSFRCEHRLCDSFSADHAWHFHPEFELTWILRSSGIRFVGSSIAPYGPGDLVLKGPNLPHCYRNNEFDDSDNHAEWIFLQFSPCQLGEAFVDLPELQAIRELLAKAKFGLHFPVSVADEVGPLLKALLTASGAGRLILLLEILNGLAKSPHSAPLSPLLPRSTGEVDGPHRRRVEAVYKYIQDNLGGTISQSEIAARMGMTPSAFSKFFRAATRQTFQSVVKTLRINEACRMLTTTSRRITEIAMDCGYQHASHFDLQFAEITGMSPRDYRRHAANKVVGEPGPV